MNSLKLEKQLRYGVFTLTFLCLFFAQTLQAADTITSLSATEVIGYEQSPTVYVELEVDKTRDLHVAFQTVKGARTIKKTMKRIKKSGKYHFEVEIDDLKAGQYRIAAYLTPRGKNWNDRLFQVKPFDFTVINEKKYVKKTIFSKQDKINFVKWPKQIIGKQEAKLTIQYDITEPRDLHIKLADSDTWKEFGALKFPVTEPGTFTLPLSNLTADFPIGNYAWIVHLAETGKKETISDKYGKHFTLSDKKVK
ncbi:hypothetical protein Q4530_08270 [Colwellia sp. 1_MG-2023]|uniref:hypothetical protein n=1 Tax=unclassified Colwellia TaxID=196834 RepID=UPI001C08A346|nr:MULTISPECIES: hypothetical protein [unclassified Colwellia]MBU2924283.1 hypothetical protein [Colwellia sp. C2M11]MDO6652992.1 hypothetical protein [Colwellia sp. 3_MG-2023]MDO6665474.1 hypothetical protein [Colwellia sp. 2_MG-2023]MDO6689767.1 hypothetical protein [Colwellia sp. 1_MG-2023]